MNLHEYIDKLSKVESKRKALESLIKSWVKVTVCGDYFHMGITYEESDMMTEDYSMDYGSMDEVLQALESLSVGAMLAKHIEL